jgi:hypothetical protein
MRQDGGNAGGQGDGGGRGPFRKYIDLNLEAPQAEQIRSQLLKSIEAATGRKCLIYAADPSKAIAPQIRVEMAQEDVTAFIDVCNSIPAGSDVDMFVESPGGYMEVAELLERLLRHRFRSVRFIVPHTAMSAATILVMSGDEILMDHKSSLGPIDPQVRQNGRQYPAQSYLDWLDKAITEERTTNRLSLVTLAILQGVTPADIQTAEDATEGARKLVTEWLAKYMWHDLRDASGNVLSIDARRTKARAVAEKLASHKEWLSHGKMLSREILLGIDKDLRIPDYSTLPCANEIWEVWVNLHYSFGKSGVYKLFESATSRIVRQVSITVPPQQVPSGPPQSVAVRYRCVACGQEGQVQANLQPGQPLQPGATAWPDGDRVLCGACQASIDLKPIREQIRQQFGKDILPAGT